MFDTATTSAIHHLHKLASEIGSRPLGSPGNLAAEAYISDVFRAAGLSVDAQRFDCIYWKLESTTLTLNGESLSAQANTFSPLCNVAGVTTAVSSIAELEAADLKDRIAILYGDLAKDALLMKGFTLYEMPDHHRIITLLEAKLPAAILTVGLSGTNEPIIQDWDFTIPSATVTPGAGLTLLRSLGETVHLTINASRIPSRSANVIATKAGAHAERIVICAHYDTKYGTPGAFDNGSGMSAVLALAEMLSQRELPCGLEFIAFNDEEYYAHCHFEYMKHRSDTLGQIIAAINLDGITHLLSTNTITVLANSQALRDETGRIVEQYPGIVWVDPWYESNHTSFVWSGVPSIAMTAPSAAKYIHLPTDTEEWVSAAKLDEVILLVKDVVEMLADKPLTWTRDPS